MATSYQVDLKFKVPTSAGLKKANADLQQLQQSAQKAQRAADPVANSLNKLQAAGNQASAGTRAATGGINNMTAAATAFAAKAAVVIGAVQALGGAMNATFERSAAEKRLQNLTKSTGEYEAALAAASSVSQQFGMTQTEATKAIGDAYGRIGSLGYGLKEVTQLYTGFNTVARNAGVSSEDAAGAFLQLSQGMGAGVLNGENLMTIMERMPQVGALLAQELNVATGQIRQMGADGKITSDVMFQALSKAGAEAADLSGKLTPAQLAMMQLSQTTENLSVAFGSTLLPAFVTGTQILADLAKGAELLVAKFNELGGNKVMEFLLTPARLFGELIGDATEKTGELSAKTSETGASAQDLVNKYSSLPEKVQSASDAQKQLNASAKEMTAIQQKGGQALSQQQTAIQQRLSVQQALLGAERSINDAKLQQAQADLDAASTQAEKESAARRVYELTKANADLTYESTVAAAEAEQAKAEAAERSATILQRQVQAEIALQRSKKIYNESQDQALIAAAQMVSTTQQAAQIQEQVTEAITRGAEATRNKEIQAAQVQMRMAAQTEQQQQTNNAIQQGAAAMSQLANEAQRAASASAGIGGGSFIGNSTSADHSGKMYDKFKVVDGKIVETTQEEREAQMNQAKVNTANRRHREIQAWNAAFEGTDYHGNAGAVHRNGGMVGPVGSDMWNAYMGRYGSNDMDRYQDNLAELSPMAEGGYVTGPTPALVGEGGEPEYIIPRSKLRGAMERYASGIRGSRMIPDGATTTSGGSSASESSDNGYKDVVNNITYSGAVMNFAGSEWISKADLPGLLNKATKQTLTTLATSARARLEAGIR